jgi:hypothetical protein
MVRWIFGRECTRYILALRRISSGYNKPTSKSSSFSCIISYLFLFFFWVCVGGGGLPPFGYIQTRCCVYFHLSACLHVMLPLLCLLTSFSSSLTWFVLALAPQKGGTSRHVRMYRRERERASRQADLAAEASLHTYIYMEYRIYNI